MYIYTLYIHTAGGGRSSTPTTTTTAVRLKQEVSCRVVSNREKWLRSAVPSILPGVMYICTLCRVFASSCLSLSLSLSLCLSLSAVSVAVSVCVSVSLLSLSLSQSVSLFLPLPSSTSTHEHGRLCCSFVRLFIFLLFHLAVSA